MKFFLIAAFLAAASAASLPYQGQSGYAKHDIAIVSQSDIRKTDGSSHWNYAGSDGTTRDESQVQKQIGYDQGNTNRGNSYWVAPGGERLTLSWVADENGFQPHGDHLPVPPHHTPEVAAVWATVRTPTSYAAPAHY